jgi:hypothetical protein
MRALLIGFLLLLATLACADVEYCPRFSTAPVPTTRHQQIVCATRAAHDCRLCRRGHDWSGTPFCQAACAPRPCTIPLPTIVDCCAAGYPVIGPDGTSLCPSYCAAANPCGSTTTTTTTLGGGTR